MPLLAPDIYDTEGDPLYAARGVFWACLGGLVFWVVTAAGLWLRRKGRKGR